MNCPHCNKNNNHQGSYCIFCGEKFDKGCRLCGFVNPLEGNFCGGCGASLKGVSHPYFGNYSFPLSDNIYQDAFGNLCIKTANGVFIIIDLQGNFKLCTDNKPNHLNKDNEHETGNNKPFVQKPIETESIQQELFSGESEGSFEESYQLDETGLNDTFSDNSHVLENIEDENLEETENSYETQNNMFSDDMIDVFYNRDEEELSAFEGSTADPWEGDEEDITEETKKGTLLPLMEKPSKLETIFDEDSYEYSEDDDDSQFVEQDQQGEFFFGDDFIPDETNLPEESIPVGDEFNRVVGITEDEVYPFDLDFEQNEPNDTEESEDVFVSEQNSRSEGGDEEMFHFNLDEEENEEVNEEVLPVPGMGKSPKIVSGMESQCVFVLDTGNNRVQKFALDGTYQMKFGSYGTAQDSFNTPKKCSGYYESGNTRIVISDFASGKIKFFDEFGNFLNEWTHAGETQLNYPMGVSYAHGRIYVVDTWNNRILVFFKDGSYSGSFGTGGEDGGQFNSPNSIVCSDELIFITDSGNNRIQVFDSGMNYQYHFGKYGSSKDDFDTPAGISFFSDKLYIADSGNNRIKVCGISGNYIGEFGRYGDSDGELDTPNGVCVDSTGRIFVADTWNNRIQVFSPDGEFCFAFGNPGKDDGQLNYPNDLFVI